MENSERRIGRKTVWGKTTLPKGWVELGSLFEEDTRRSYMNPDGLHNPNSETPVNETQFLTSGTEDGLAEDDFMIPDTST